MAVALFGTAVPVACSSDSGLVAGAGGLPGRAGGAGGSGVSGAGGPGASGGKSTAGSGSGAAAGAPAHAGTAGGGGAGGSAGKLAGAGSAGVAGAAGSTSPAGRGGAGNGTGGEAGETNVAGAGGDSGGGSEEIPPGYVKAILGVGYGGIRILSRDGGNTWGDRVYAAPSGGDDEDLLRAVAYGKGRWIATGWKLMSSDDGVHWTDHGLLKDGILAHNPIVEGLAYKDGYFYAAGDGGSGAYIYRSSDGLSWSDFGRGGDTVKHTGLTVHGGLFVSYGDSETSYQSTDGKTWSEMDVANATYCEGQWRTLAACHDAWWLDDGFYILPEWGGQIRRSTTGSNFKTVYTDDQENTLYRARAVAEGYAAPE
jgi:hypothetical protein